MKVALCFSPVGLLYVSGLPTELDQIAVLACPLQAKTGTESAQSSENLSLEIIFLKRLRRDFNGNTSFTAQTCKCFVFIHQSQILPYILEKNWVSVICVSCLASSRYYPEWTQGKSCQQQRHCELDHMGHEAVRSMPSGFHLLSFFIELLEKKDPKTLLHFLIAIDLLSSNMTTVERKPLRNCQYSVMNYF